MTFQQMGSLGTCIHVGVTKLPPPPPPSSMASCQTPLSGKPCPSPIPVTLPTSVVLSTLQISLFWNRFRVKHAGQAFG